MSEAEDFSKITILYFARLYRSCNRGRNEIANQLITKKLK